jgi:ribosome-associated translation inhibitor RaiA
MMEVEVAVRGDIPRDHVNAAREQIASLEHYVGHPLTSARLTLTHYRNPHLTRPYVADASLHLGDASLRFEGRPLAAHAAGHTAVEAAEAVAERLRRQLRRVVGAEVALRNEPSEIRAALDALEHDQSHRPEVRLKPPEERDIVHRRTYDDSPPPTLSAVADLLDLDQEFYLFRHARTGEDVVVYRRDDGRIGLIYPSGSALADENDVIVAQPSRYSSPLTLDVARSEMDMLNHRFLYFIDADDGRGKVLYLRHDGDYGLVEPE